jgi:hypothetical protein
LRSRRRIFFSGSSSRPLQAGVRSHSFAPPCRPEARPAPLLSWRRSRVGGRADQRAHQGRAGAGKGEGGQARQSEASTRYARAGPPRRRCETAPSRRSRCSDTALHRGGAKGGMHHAGAAGDGAERAGCANSSRWPLACGDCLAPAGTRRWDERNALVPGSGREVPSPQFETVQLGNVAAAAASYTPALAEMASKNTKFSPEIPILSAVPHEMTAVDNQIRHPVMPRPCNSDCAAYGVHDPGPPAVHVYERRGAASA